MFHLTNLDSLDTFHLKTEPDNINIMGNGCNLVLNAMQRSITRLVTMGSDPGMSLTQTHS